MEVPNTIVKYGTLVLMGLILLLVIGGAIGRSRYEKQLAQLRNEVASKTQTIEVQKGVYEKLSLTADDLRKNLDLQDKQVKELNDELKKKKEDLLAANQLVVKWKKAYEGAAEGHQTEVPGTDPKVVRKRVDFDKDFGAIGVQGWTLTDPPEAWVKVTQLKPLQITLVVSQDKDKRWHTYATSSDENTSVDIKLSAVNPYLLDPKWYEKLQLNTMLAVGSGQTGAGVLAGVGISYRIKQFDVGPAVFLGISDRVDRYFGATFSWRPFQSEQ